MDYGELPEALLELVQFGAAWTQDIKRLVIQRLWNGVLLLHHFD